MVDRIGERGALAQESILAALRAQQASAERVARAAAAGADAARPTAGPGDFAAALGTSGAPRGAAAELARSVSSGVEAVTEGLRANDVLPERLVTGEISDFYEVATQLKSSELSFRFALEVRNKLVDAYREVMRMNL
jgi:flagellar hook-basal body complex protein FliE